MFLLMGLRPQPLPGPLASTWRLIVHVTISLPMLSDRHRLRTLRVLVIDD